MADDHRNRSFRASESLGRARPSDQGNSDPLAELARLIGQQNESTPLPPLRQGSVRAAAAEQKALNNRPSQVLAAKQQESQKQQYQQEEYQQDQYAPQAQYPASYGKAQSSYDPNAYGDAQYDPRYDANPPYNDPNYAQYAQPQADPRYSDAGYQDQRLDNAGYDPRYANYDANAGYAAGQDSGYAAGQGYADPNAAHYGQDQGQYADPSAYAQYADGQQGYPQYADQHGYAPQYADGQQQGYSDQYYGQSGYGQDGYAQQPHGQSPYGQMPQAVTRPIGEEPTSKRRGGMVTVLAILALAVVGTATAFGYRAIFGGSGAAVPPPVIQADVNPSKIVPATDPNAKPIQDRIGALSEKLVSREEQPVEMRNPAQSARVVFPNLAGQGQAANVAPAGAAGVPAPSEPKRVRTVTIKPDQGPDEPASRSAPQRNAAPTSVDDILNGAPSQPSPSSNGPLALSPTTVPQDQSRVPTPAPAQRQAARTPSSGSPFPAPITTGTSTPTGAFAVQVTSQRTESDAQASYRALQQQFPSVLGSHQPVIRRADLGSKGTYYRAQIPFNTQGEASQFCGNLKAAGGQCVVQRN